MKKLFFILLGLCIASSSPAQTARQTLLGTFGDWSAYTYMENKNRVCYMASIPARSEGKYSTRGSIYLLITHRPAEKTFDTISMTAGYTYKDGSKANLKVDGNKGVDLLTHEDTAWASDSKTDALTVKQMRAGSTAVITGTSSRGTLTTDTFSLKGFTKAYNAMSNACKKK